MKSEHSELDISHSKYLILHWKLFKSFLWVENLIECFFVKLITMHWMKAGHWELSAVWFGFAALNQNLGLTREQVFSRGFLPATWRTFSSREARYQEHNLCFCFLSEVILTDVLRWNLQVLRQSPIGQICLDGFLKKQWKVGEAPWIWSLDIGQSFVQKVVFFTEWRRKNQEIIWRLAADDHDDHAAADRLNQLFWSSVCWKLIDGAKRRIPELPRTCFNVFVVYYY